MMEAQLLNKFNKNLCNKRLILPQQIMWLVCWLVQLSNLCF